MATHKLDLRGLKCPTPTLRMTNFILGGGFQPGDILSATADCPSFEADVRKWCATVKKMLVVIRDAPGGAKVVDVRL